MQAIDTKHIKIGRFVKELWHFEDKLSKLEWENQTFWGGAQKTQLSFTP